MTFYGTDLTPGGCLGGVSSPHVRVQLPCALPIMMHLHTYMGISAVEANKQDRTTNRDELLEFLQQPSSLLEINFRTCPKGLGIRKYLK